MPLPAKTERVKRESSRQLVYRQLKKFILDLTLEPLEILRDGQLAARLGVSRTPVREALLALENEGLVQSHRNQWTRVSGVDLEDAIEIYPVIRSLHETALRLAFPRLIAEDLLELEAANEQMSLAIKSGQAAKALGLDAMFHRIIVARAPNILLSNLVTALTERLYRIELAHFSEAGGGAQSVSQHQALIRALRRRQLALALRRMAENWQCPHLTATAA